VPTAVCRHQFDGDVVDGFPTGGGHDNVPNATMLSIGDSSYNPVFYIDFYINLRSLRNC
jgi:hypothetical protein